MNLCIALLATICMSPLCGSIVSPSTTKKISSLDELFSADATQVAVLHKNAPREVLPKDATGGLDSFLEQVAEKPAEWIEALITEDPTYTTVTGPSGKTLLHYLAEKSSDKDLFELIAATNPDARTAKDAAGATPQSIYTKRGSIIPAIQELLNPNTLLIVTLQGFKRIQTADDYFKYKKQINPNTASIDQKYLDILIEKNIDTYTAIIDDENRWAQESDMVTGETILHRLARKPDLEALEEKIAYALAKGADKNAQNISANTPYEIYDSINGKNKQISALLNPDDLEKTLENLAYALKTLE